MLKDRAPRILFLRERGKTKAFSTRAERIGSTSSFSTLIFLRIQIHTTWSHLYHLTVVFHSTVQWGYADWKDKGWVRRVEQDHPCEAQMKKLKKGKEKIFDLRASLNPVKSSSSCNHLVIFFASFFSFATWPAVRKGPSPTVMFPSGKVGARGHFSNCCYQTSAGRYILS